jgi:hypothetical protein
MTFEVTIVTLTLGGHADRARLWAIGVKGRATQPFGLGIIDDNPRALAY